MIITRTPFRISLFGGGTDYVPWYRKYSGLVVGTAIDKYSYICCRKLPPFHDFKGRFVYADVEKVNDVQEIKHQVIQAVLQDYYNGDCDLEITHMADLPSRSGIGSSSSFTVGLLHAILALQKKSIVKSELLSAALHIEQSRLQEHVGSQDQTWAIYGGGFNKIFFHQNGHISIVPISLSQTKTNEIRRSIMLFFTGINRTANVIAATYVPTITEKYEIQHQLYEIATQSYKYFNTANVEALGRLLDKSWQLKKSLSDAISNNYIDTIYQTAKQNGAFGGKISGAGGGGFMVFIVPFTRQDNVKQALQKEFDLIHVPFDIALKGTQIIFSEDE